MPDGAREVVARGIAADISGTTIWRWLSEDAIRPWRSRSWIFPRAADFEAKARRVLDLYAHTWEGKALGKRDFVISADEKTSIQARQRCRHLGTPPHGPTGASSTSTTGAAPSPTWPPWPSPPPRSSTAASPPPDRAIGRLVERVMGTEPYASARRVFSVLGNGSGHRGQRSVDRMHQRWPKSRGSPTKPSWVH